MSYRRDQYNFINADSDSTTAGSLDILIQFGNIWNQQKSAGRTFHLLDTTMCYNYNIEENLACCPNLFTFYC